VGKQNLAIVYDPECPKLKPDAYSQTYRDMFLALIKRFDEVLHITTDRRGDFDADVIIFFDIHSSHHIEIEGIENHPAIKYEYFNDPWQVGFKGKYKDGTEVHKLSNKERSIRANQRGVQYVICPYENLYYRYIEPWFEGELVWFPIAPNLERCRRDTRLKDRKPEVLLNGHLWPGTNGFHPYAFRRWAYTQDGITKINHNVYDKNTPAGIKYPDFLASYAGSMALCDTHICPKYSEIPLAGCLCFAQYQWDYVKMGFVDHQNCVYVTMGNFKTVIEGFKNNIEQYQPIADAGRKLIEENWTADKFADFIYNHANR
jgi:hypothetical protein